MRQQHSRWGIGSGGSGSGAQPGLGAGLGVGLGGNRRRSDIATLLLPCLVAAGCLALGAVLVYASLTLLQALPSSASPRAMASAGGGGGDGKAAEAAEAVSVLLEQRFEAGSELDPRLVWAVHASPGPGRADIVDGVLRISPDRATDFWRSTYYTPLLVKDDGYVLGVEGITDPFFSVETHFTLRPTAQFDQAGLAIRVDAHNWIKTGIEFVDGHGRASVVVTNGRSDWSTQPWRGLSMHVRVHRVAGSSFVVEMRASPDEPWAFSRIAPLTVLVPPEAAAAEAAGKTPPTPAVSAPVTAGMFVAAPTAKAPDGAALPAAAAALVDFHAFRITRGRAFHHDY